MYLLNQSRVRFVHSGHIFRNWIIIYFLINYTRQCFRKLGCSNSKSFNFVFPIFRRCTDYKMRSEIVRRKGFWRFRLSAFWFNVGNAFLIHQNAHSVTWIKALNRFNSNFGNFFQGIFGLPALRWYWFWNVCKDHETMFCHNWSAHPTDSYAILHHRHI